MKNISINEFVKRFDLGEFDKEDVMVQVEAGWYDWFCKDSSLKNKTKMFGRIVRQLKNSNKIDLDKDYVWFKNNCPLSYPLYDDFRIADLEDDKVKYIVSCKNPYYQGKRWAVFGIENDFDEPLLEVDSIKEVIAFLNGNKELEN